MPRSSPHFSTGLSLHNTSYTNIPGRTVESAVGLLSPILAPPTGQPRLGQPPFSNRSPQDARGANGIDRVRCSRGSACPAGAAKSACRCCRSASVPPNSGARLRLAPTNSGARSPGHESVALPRRGTPNRSLDGSPRAFRSRPHPAANVDPGLAGPGRRSGFRDRSAWSRDGSSRPPLDRGGRPQLGRGPSLGRTGRRPRPTRRFRVVQPEAGPPPERWTSTSRKVTTRGLRAPSIRRPSGRPSGRAPGARAQAFLVGVRASEPPGPAAKSAAPSLVRPTAFSAIARARTRPKKRSRPLGRPLGIRFHSIGQSGRRPDRAAGR